jgi:hypothetical protein
MDALLFYDFVYMYVCVRMCMRMYVCMYVCMYVFVLFLSVTTIGCILFF